MSAVTKEVVELVGAWTVSVVLLAAGLYVLLHRGASSDLQKAATGWIGIAAGYWLK